MQRATIADVAARAGVTKSTVSHALSGKRPVSDETRRRVEQAIAELNYRPHAVAQRLAGGRGQTVGLAYPLYAPEVAGLEIQFMAGAATVINQADYSFILLTHPERRLDDLVRFVQGGMLDGVILMQVRLHDPRIAILRDAGLPFVLVGRSADNTGLAYIDLDVDAAIAQCVDYLVGLGHRSLAYLRQDEADLGFAVRPRSAYAAACSRHDLPVLMPACGLSAPSGKQAMTELFKAHPDVTAVITWNDLAAWGVMQAAEAHGRRIPDDLSLICFDNSTLANIVPFVPTVVDIRPREMASEAAHMLLAILNAEPLLQSQRLLDPVFIVGKTTASAQARRKEV